MKSLGGTIKLITAVSMFVTALSAPALAEGITFKNQESGSQIDKVVSAYFSEFLAANPRATYKASTVDLNDDNIAEIAVQFANNDECDADACRTVIMAINNGKPVKVFDANARNVEIEPAKTNLVRNLFVDNKYTFRYKDGHYHIDPLKTWTAIRLRQPSNSDPKRAVAYDSFMKNYGYIVRDTGVEPIITLGQLNFSNQGPASLIASYNHQSICSSFFGCPIFIFNLNKNGSYDRVFEGYSTNNVYVSKLSRGAYKDVIISSRDRFTNLRYSPVTKTFTPEESTPRIYYIGN